VDATLFKYLLIGGYALLVYWLSWVGMRKTSSAEGFAIGNKDMSPVLVGITLAASISSTATFVINPGFVYVHGVSAYVHFGIAGSLGIMAAFIVLTRGFLRVGEAQGSLTIPQWIYQRYQSRSLGLFFALINLLSITFVVLILVGCSLLVSGLFPVEQKTALVLVVLFVFSYVLMGGTYAHAYTNTLQGVLMLAVAGGLFFHGLHYLGSDPWEKLEALGADYAAVFNTESSLYFSFFSVFVSGFVITFALMLQPHILTKILYLRSERDANVFILTTVLAGAVFMLMLMIGFYARLAGYDIETQDMVVREYLIQEFSGDATGQLILTFIFVALLAAGMSTLDGILVALSAVVVTDILKPMGLAEHHGLKLSRYVLVGVGILGLALAWNPPPVVGLFAQKGVYGLAAASIVPVLFGVMLKGHVSLWVVAPAALLGLGTHLVAHLALGVANPAVSATYGIFAALLWGVLSQQIIGRIR
jgi:SSS family solute:Na+ symporter/sodium/pantothenate symporter